MSDNNPCVAHRGFSGKAPENTLAAIRMALELPYVTWLEIDVQLSRDGVPVVIHDYSLDRTTNGHGRVKEMDYANLRRLDAGSWKSKSYRGEKIPSLEEVLELAAGRAKLNIELKNVGRPYPDLERRVTELIASKGMREEVVLTSFDAPTLRRLRDSAPDFRTGLIFDARWSSPVRPMQQLGCSFLSIKGARLNTALARFLTQRGAEVMAWTVDKPESMRRLADIHSDIMICTNRPDLWGETFWRQ
ncbi:glycerophosphodiester phosphodiesterase [Paenibacillus spiritus]|uniref:Glycerophosphodiester phosphodiesterase n=1 Tax=Paenibacillus spiritus TaxID=2496557 RepID=A0A5J5FZN1_9BACL|nr:MULTISPECIES: glycerophosphodiester phosphodiesterase family protein [Paenibacillus]KAA8999808.1 glycerophosphodiester phosphodiesterase [Paenibacillus spiritus]